ncbi:MAG: GGDEF domain-containing protein [Gallionella sp.]
MSTSLIPSNPDNTPIGVLRSIATLTSHRDRDLLARTLIRTLSGLIHSRCITMYRILPTNIGMEALFVTQSYCDEVEVEVEVQTQTQTQTQTSIIIADHPNFQHLLDSKKEFVQPVDEHTLISIYPITDNENIVGILEIISGPHSEIDRHLISAFLKVYSNFITILDESETDTLTGLLNRRTFEKNIEKIISNQPDIDNHDAQFLVQRNLDNELPHWLAIMDIDHFKRINDEFGHLYGDEVLLLLSRNMKRIFRQRDQLFRFGGEEFIVVLDRTDLENAKKVLERFRAAIEDYHFPQVGKVTISIGFVPLSKVEVPSSLVGRADQALYYAKEHGRNQVCYYDDLISEGKLVVEHFTDDIELF